MIRKRRHGSNVAKRRTTLSLPVESLVQAERIAHARDVNLSVVIAEALSEGLRAYRETERSKEILSAYKKAFTGFTGDEMSILDGIVLEPVTRRRR